MASIELKNVGVEFAIYSGRGRSIRASLAKRAIGSVIEHRMSDDVTIVRALDGISLKLDEGHRVGLVGNNGAGKTTLSRVLAGIYPPCTGSIAIRGRVASLTDLTLGMDLEATGYENVILRGTVLGLSRKESRALFDDIAEFTELGEYLDLPVRTYSSGMLTRLGVGIATSIMPEILIMDEMIGVVDVNFVEKAQQRINKIIDGSSLFVLASHSEAIIRRFCNRVVRLEAGKVVADGPPEQVMAPENASSPAS